MIQPWETLLGHLRANWMLRDYLDSDIPPLKAILDDERYRSLSTGEQAMLTAAGALMQLNECWLVVDEANQARIEAALVAFCAL